MNEEKEKRDYLAKMKAERGYVLDFHTVLAEEDLPFLKSYNALHQSALFNPDTNLDAKTKRLILIAMLLAVRSPADHLRTHFQSAKEMGIAKAEVLEVLEMCLIPAGLPAFMEGFALWRQVYGD